MSKDKLIKIRMKIGREMAELWAVFECSQVGLFLSWDAFHFPIVILAHINLVLAVKFVLLSPKFLDQGLIVAE